MMFKEVNTFYQSYTLFLNIKQPLLYKFRMRKNESGKKLRYIHSILLT